MNLEDVDKWAAWAGAWILFLTPLVFLAQKFAHAWLEYSLLTPSTLDDRVARALVWLFDSAAKLIMLFPRVTMNLDAIKGMRDAMRKLPKPPAALMILLVLLPLGGFSTGCAGMSGGRIGTTRTALLVTDGVVDRVNEQVGPLYTAAHVQAMSSATSADGSLDQTAYDRAMRRWNRVDTAITSVQVALDASATSIESAAAGIAGYALGSIACAVQALTELAAALPDVGVNVPALLRSGIGLLRDVAEGVCPDASATPSADVEGTS